MISSSEIYPWRLSFINKVNSFLSMYPLESLSIFTKARLALKSNSEVPLSMASSSSLYIAPNSSYLAVTLFKPEVLESEMIILGIIIPSKHPMVIPKALAHMGPSSVSVIFSIIFPQNVPRKIPRVSEKVLPYPAVTFASSPPGKRAKISSRYTPPKNRPALSMNPKITLANIPTSTVVIVTPSSPLIQSPKLPQGTLY